MQRDNRRSREDGGGGYEPTSTFADVEAAAMLESGERKRRLATTRIRCPLRARGPECAGDRHRTRDNARIWGRQRERARDPAAAQPLSKGTDHRRAIAEASAIQKLVLQLKSSQSRLRSSPPPHSPHSRAMRSAGGERERVRERGWRAALVALLDSPSVEAQAYAAAAIADHAQLKRLSRSRDCCQRHRATHRASHNRLQRGVQGRSCRCAVLAFDVWQSAAVLQTFSDFLFDFPTFRHRLPTSSMSAPGSKRADMRKAFQQLMDT